MRYAILLSVAALLAGCEQASKPRISVSTDGRPNLLLIILDDVGFEHIGRMRSRPSEDMPRTPNIDALCDGGMWFSKCYANPNCSPTRATIATGRYGFRTGVGAIIGRSGTAELAVSEVILPEVLVAAGYDCSLVGKWHLGSGDHAVRSGWPWSSGTEGNIVNVHAGRASVVGRDHKTTENYWHWPKTTNGTREWCDRYATAETTDDALRRMGEMKAPWLLWLSYNAIHGPWHVPPDGTHHYAPAELADSPQMQSYAMTENIDYEIGRLLAQMSPASRRNTVIALISDNGPQGWDENGRPAVEWASREKGNLAHGGQHVPLIINGSCISRDVRGARCDSLVSATDLFTTLVELAGGAAPADRPIDGVSLLPLFNDPAAAVRSFVYSERFPHQADGGEIEQHRFMISDGEWSLHYEERDGQPTLYRHDRSLDPRIRESPQATEAAARLRAAATELLGAWPG
jgi:arylsulfatase A-like enzyme